MATTAETVVKIESAEAACRLCRDSHRFFFDPNVDGGWPHLSAWWKAHYAPRITAVVLIIGGRRFTQRVTIQKGTP